MKLKFIYIVLGFSALVSQLVILREFIALFQGNELSWGIVFASWVFWTGLGSGIFIKLFEKYNPQKSFVFLQIMVSITVILTLVIIKFVPQLFGTSFGQLLGFIPLIISTLLIAPMCILWGLQFSLGGKLATEPSISFNVSQVYVYETVGAIIGGLFYNYLFTPYLNPLQIMVVIGSANLVSGWLLQYTNPPVSPFNKVGTAKQILILVLLMVNMFLLLNNKNIYNSLIKYSIGKSYQLVETKDSIYGNITIIKRDNQYSFYENGVYTFSTETGLINEETVHIPLLQCKKVESVLLIGGGASGCLDQILSYPDLKQVYYIELDPNMIKLAAKYLAPKSFSDPRVRIIYTDARHFVKSFAKHISPRPQSDSSLQKRNRKVFNKKEMIAEPISYIYDLDAVILNLPDPNSAQINRFYTLEFFQQIKNILNPDGVFSLGLTSSETYFTEELKQFNQSIYFALKQVFLNTLIIPGTHAYFLASSQNNFVSDYSRLKKNIKRLSPKPQFISVPYLKSRIQPDRIEFVTKTFENESDVDSRFRLNDRKNRMNTDFKPVTYLHTLTLWILQFNIGATRLLSIFNQTNPVVNIILPLILVALFFFIFPRHGENKIFYTTIITGMLSLGGELLILLSFQTLYGNLYYRVALLITMFMAGLFIGSQWAKNVVAKDNHKTNILLIINQIILAIVFIIFPFILNYLSKINNSVLIQTILFLLIGIIGLLTGKVFPLANDIFFKENTGITIQKYGKIYFLDLIGGCVGAVLTTLFFVPILGIYQTSVLFGIISLTSVIKLYLK